MVPSLAQPDNLVKLLASSASNIRVDNLRSVRRGLWNVHGCGTLFRMAVGDSDTRADPPIWDLGSNGLLGNRTACSGHRCFRVMVRPKSPIQRHARVLADRPC